MLTCPFKEEEKKIKSLARLKKPPIKWAGWRILTREVSLHGLTPNSLGHWLRSGLPGGGAWRQLV